MPMTGGAQTERFLGKFSKFSHLRFHPKFDKCGWFSNNSDCLFRLSSGLGQFWLHCGLLWHSLQPDNFEQGGWSGS